MKTFHLIEETSLQEIEEKNCFCDLRPIILQKLCNYQIILQTAEKKTTEKNIERCEIMV